jgi:Pyrimidine operon attenuation protein/uracil phosphoribosyltransferase
MTPQNSKLVLDAKALEAVIADLARSVTASEKQGGEYLFVGIHTRGIPLAHRLAKRLGRPDVKIGMLDINLYRDDLSKVADMPVVKQTSIPHDLEGSRILLIDDVLFTGRTVRSALDALIDLGRPRRIELLALVDRGGRELPIQADFCGKTCDVAMNEVVKVKFIETDGVDEVVIAPLSGI